jgi:hypothetical protein
VGSRHPETDRIEDHRQPVPHHAHTSVITKILLGKPGLLMSPAGPC